MNQDRLSLKSLQVGRALAASAVVAFHLSLMMGEARYGGEAVFNQYTKLGYLGVDFFFVLSGFIIIVAHAADIGKPDGLRSYARRRFVRLYPIYWLYTGVLSALLLAGLGTVATMPTSPVDILTSLTLIRFSAATPPLAVAWTLFNELAFYTLFGLLIYNVRAGIAAFAISAVLGFAFFHPPVEGDAFTAYTSASNLYFLLGMGAYVLYRRGGSGLVEVVGGLGLAASAAAFISSVAEVPLWYAVARFTVVCGFALALGGVAKLELAGRFTVPLWAVYVGDASYSIYLLHSNLAGLLLKIAVRTDAGSLLGSSVEYIIVLFVSIALGCLAYGAVEKPLLAALRRKPEKVRTVIDQGGA